MALSLHGMIVCGRWELLLLKKKSINANRKERKCLKRFLANFLDTEWNFKERSWGSFSSEQMVSWSGYLRYQESGQDRNMLGAVWESEVFQIQIQRYKHNINMYEKQIFVKRNKN